MARQMKVYGGCYDGRNRVIVAAPNKKAAWQAVNATWPPISYYSWDQFTSDTGNDDELAVALAEPLTVFIQNINARDGLFTKVIARLHGNVVR